MVRLYLTMMALLSLHSCRQDLLTEKETYHNTSAFRLTSKRISLDESKHKAKLLPELQKAKKEVEKQKLNIQGKLVDIGNGIIIDTDEVIYMENGPDFHTYTFSVVRENASANAPVENILMSPNTDGSYRVFHIVLNLTEADKAKIANREYINYKNKSQVTELASMNLSSLAQRSNCTPEYYQYPVPCSGPEMHLPGKPGCPLEGGERAYWATGVFWNCQNIPEPVDHIIAPSEGGPGGGSGSTDPGTPPDDCITTVTNPGEVGLINESGCNTIVPTEPNIRPTQTPCQKTKAMLENPAVQTKLDSLKNHSTGTGELGFKIKKDGTTSDIIDGGEHEVALGDMTGWQGAYHNHTSTGIPMHSPPDIDNGLLKLARSQPTQPVGEHNNAYFGMIVKKACSTCTGGFKIYHYLIRLNGTYANATTTFSQEKLDKLKFDYQKREKELSEILPYVDFLGAANLNNKGLEKLFFDTLTNMNIPHNVITLQRVDDDGNGNITVKNITLDASGVPQAIPCP